MLIHLYLIHKYTWKTLPIPTILKRRHIPTYYLLSLLTIQSLSFSVLENETKVVEEQKVDEDPLTRAIGAIGKWQIWICFVVFLVKFPVAWHQMSIIFLAPPMNFTCATNQSNGIYDNQCEANCSQYEYDHSVFQETIISEWDLVCDKTWLKNLTQTIFMLGILVGNMVFGHLADRSVPSLFNFATDSSWVSFIAT